MKVLYFLKEEILQPQCMGYDYVIDRDTGKPYIIEMCFSFDWESLSATGGYWDRQHKWHSKPLIVQHDIIANLFEGKLL